MCKEDILEKIQKAKRSHIQWLKRIKHLIEDMPILDEMIELNPKRSGFGIWLYRDAQACSSVAFFSELFILIEKDHLYLHEVYTQIYRIYFFETKRNSLVAYILGENKKIKMQKQIEAIEHYNQLIDTSNRLLLNMSKLERKIKMSSASIIEKCLVA